MFVLFIAILLSCDNEKNEAEKDKLYVSSVSDLSTQQPFHQVMFQKTDGLYKYDFWSKNNSYSDIEISQLKHKDTLAFDNEDLLMFIEPYTLYQDLITFYNDTSILSYVEAAIEQELNGDDFIDKVKGQIYTTQISNFKTPNTAFDIQEYVSFQNQEIEFIWEYSYSGEIMYTETESVPFELFEVEKQLFIVPSTQDNPYPILHVKNVKTNELELSYFIDFETKTKSYTVIDSRPINGNTTNYSLCKDSYQSLYYVGEDVRYSKGMEHLKTYLQTEAPRVENEGYINLHFTVNCKGEVGRFGLELLDENYISTDFDADIIQHIINKVSSLENWDNVDSISHRGAKDAKMFFLIKVENHKIVDVCP